MKFLIIVLKFYIQVGYLLKKNIDKLIKVWQKEVFYNCELILVGDSEIELDKNELQKKVEYF